jgi:hypothetical protein
MRNHPHYYPDDENGIHDDHQKIHKKKKKKPAGRILWPQDTLQPPVEVIRRYQRQHNDQQYEETSKFHDVTISLAFSSAAAVGFSPLSILAIAVIRSSWSNRSILVLIASPLTSL